MKRLGLLVLIGLGYTLILCSNSPSDTASKQGVLKSIYLRPLRQIVIHQACTDENFWRNMSPRPSYVPIVKVELTVNYNSGIQETLNFELAADKTGNYSYPVNEPVFTFQEDNSPITKHVYLQFVRKLVKEPSGAFTIYLTNGKIFKAKWVERTPEFYLEHVSTEHPTTGLHIMPNKHLNNPTKINLTDIVSIQVHCQLIEENISSLKKPWYLITGGPVTFVLKDGSLFRTESGYILDYCGHSYGTGSHPSLYRSKFGTTELLLKIIDDNAQYEQIVDCAPIETIQFTGKLTRGGCREIVIKFKDGSSKRTNLSLTSESYGGTCFLGDRRTDLDSVVGEADYGWFQIPLDYVSKIVFNMSAEAKS